MSQVEQLAKQLDELRLHHRSYRTVDSCLYNGGTAVVLLCSALATSLPTAAEGFWFWFPKALSGFATFWVALDRTLSFGQRWRFHTQMEHGYQSLLLDLGTIPSAPEEKRQAAVESIRAEFAKLRQKETAIPGIVGGPEIAHTNPKPPGTI